MANKKKDKTITLTIDKEVYERFAQAAQSGDNTTMITLAKHIATTYTPDDK
jgi:hypothetical protein